MKKPKLIAFIMVVIIAAALFWYFSTSDTRTPQGEFVIKAFVDSKAQLIKMSVRSMGELKKLLSDEEEAVKIGEKIVEEILTGYLYSVETEKNYSDAYCEYVIRAVTDKKVLLTVLIYGTVEQDLLFKDIRVELINSDMFDDMEYIVSSVKASLKSIAHNICSEVSLTGVYEGNLTEKKDSFSNFHMDSEMVDMKYNPYEDKTYVTVKINN